MKKINVDIDLNCDIPELYSGDNKKTVGAISDNNAQTIIFNRAEIFEPYNMMLRFRDGLGYIYEKNIGLENEYTIPNILTRSKTLYLQIYFFTGSEFRWGTNWLEFQFSDSISKGETLEEFACTKIGEVTAKPLPSGAKPTAEVTYINGKLNFTFGIPAGSGDGGTSDYDDSELRQLLGKTREEIEAISSNYVFIDELGDIVYNIDSL